MRPKLHIYFFCVTTTLWTFFFLGGLWSTYYQEWTWYWQLIVIDWIPVLILIYRAPALIRSTSEFSTMRSALWLAFYFSIPFLAYDFIYLQLYKELPFSYLMDYWYLTAFSVVPWIIFPLSALGFKKEITNVQTFVKKT